MTVRKAASYRLTFNDAVEIHASLAAGELQSRIAARYDVNGGRISEVNTGKLHPGSYEEACRRYGIGRGAA